MKTAMHIEQLWFSDDRIYILTSDGRKLWQSLLWYHRLLNATDKQRLNYRVSFSGIHWCDVDEDISFESFLYSDSEPVGISRLFLTHPELNASEVAQQAGIEQHLLMSYIRGSKKISPEHETKIKNAVRNIGKKLMEI